MRKNDSRNEVYLFEQKRTDNTKGIRINEKDLSDLRKHAAQITREGVLTFELNGRHYYVIEEPLWEELTDDGELEHDHDEETKTDSQGCCSICGDRLECSECGAPYDEDEDAFGLCITCFGEEDLP